LSGSTNCCTGGAWTAQVAVELKATQNWNLSGVLVTGQWTGAHGGVVSGAADGGGNVVFQTPSLVVDESVTFTVLDVSGQPPLVYDPGKNRVNSVTIPSPL
jgi:type 1 fimbria pilin